MSHLNIKAYKIEAEEEDIDLSRAKKESIQKDNKLSKNGDEPVPSPTLSDFKRNYNKKEEIAKEEVQNKEDQTFYEYIIFLITLFFGKIQEIFNRFAELIFKLKGLVKNPLFLYCFLFFICFSYSYDVVHKHLLLTKNCTNATSPVEENL